MSSSEMLLWNDIDGVEGIVQSITELCVSKDSNKKLAAEVWPNSVPDHKEIVNDTAQAMLNPVLQQGGIINEAAETLPNSVTEQGEIISEVSMPSVS